MVALAAAHWRRAAAESFYAIFGVRFQPKKRRAVTSSSGSWGSK
jgi:hypothetical protein